MKERVKERRQGVVCMKLREMLQVDNRGKCLFVSVYVCGYKVVPLFPGYRSGDMAVRGWRYMCVHVDIL